MRAAKILGVDPTDLSDEDARAALDKLTVPKSNFRIRKAIQEVRGQSDKLA